MTNRKGARRAEQAPPLQPKSEIASPALTTGAPCPYDSRVNTKSQSSKHLMGGLGLVDAEGDLVGDADAVDFEGDDFFRVIGEHANVLEAEVDQDLRANATFVLDQA